MTLVGAIEERIRDSLGLQALPGTSLQLARELASVQRELGFDTAEIARRILCEPDLVLRLASALTVQESFFLRHPEQFDVLTAHVRKELERSPNARLLIWSAGCASGEEPYSIAMAIDQSLGRAALARVQIIATDVNQLSLEKARRGVYGAWSFRGLSPALLSTYFQAERGGASRLIAPILHAVEFRHRSIEQELAELLPATLDAVFFRNVGIYLTEPALARVYAGIARVLKEYAPLLLGPADPLPVRPELCSARGEERMTLRKLTRPSAASLSTAKPASSSRPAPRAERGPSASARRAARVAPCPRPGTPAPPSAASVISEAQSLADRGQLSEALARLDQALSRSPPRAELLGLRGRIQLLMGNSALGVRDLRAALFLDPTQLVLRFHYALSLDALQRHRACRAQLLEIVRALGAHGEAERLEDGESTVGSLRSAVQEVLRRLP